MNTVSTSRNSLLLKYLAQLSLHPLRTKALTTGARVHKLASKDPVYRLTN
jgi:hypothetical protein